MQTVGEMFNGLSQVIKSLKLNCVVSNSQDSRDKYAGGAVASSGLINRELRHEVVEI